MISEYEIIVKDKHDHPVNVDDYEEMTVEEFFEMNDLDVEEQNSFIRKNFAINIHVMLSDETYDIVVETMNDYLIDDRLKGLNCIVILSLKQKGRGIKHNPVSLETFKNIVDFSFDDNIPIGFDSCSADKFLKSVKDRDNYKQLEMLSEPCESFGNFSCYINVDADYYPCSFLENQHEDFKGVNIPESDFMKDVWYSGSIKKWRKIMQERRDNKDFSCPIYNV